MVVASIGKTPKQGFVRKGVKGKFLKGTISKFGNKKGMAQKAMIR